MKLSVITITRNNLSGLQKTLASVAAQSARENFEFIVIDGASSDGTKEFLTAHKEEIDFFISEADSGIYNAMNKGILHAHGAYCIFMNSGDTFADPEVVRDMLPHLDKEYAMVFGVGLDAAGKEHSAIPHVKLRHFWGVSFPHQASFIRRDLFEKYGLYREEYRCASDIFFFYEMIFVRKIPYKVTSRIVARNEEAGISGTATGRKEWRHYALHHMNFFHRVYCLLLELYAMLQKFFSGEL